MIFRLFSGLRVGVLCGVLFAFGCPTRALRTPPVDFNPDVSDRNEGRQRAEGVQIDDTGQRILVGRRVDVQLSPAPDVLAWAPPKGADPRLTAVIEGPGDLRVDFFELDGDDARGALPATDAYADLFIDCGPYLEADHWAVGGVLCTARYTDPTWPEAVTDEMIVAVRGGVLRLRARLPEAKYTSAVAAWQQILAGLRPRSPR